MDVLINTTTNIVEDFFYGIKIPPTETQTFLTGAPEDVVVGWIYNPIDKTFSKSDELKFKDIRKKRALLLSESDYTQLTDSTQKGTKDEWKIYRQTLRDITKGVTDPDTIVFPEEPK